MVRLYFEFARKSFQQKFVYRANSYISIVSALLSLFIQISVWKALFSVNATVNGITFPDMINYIIINLIVLSIINSRMGERLADKVYDGSICNDFIRPVNLKFCMMSEQLGENCYRTIFSTIPVCVIAILFLKFQLPFKSSNFILFIISVLNGVVLIYYINYILGLLAFWFKTSYYVGWFMKAIFSLFAGTFVPIWFYPGFLYKLSKLLPLRLVSFEPISIYLGKLTFQESVKVIITQAVWIIILIFLEKFVWNGAQKQVTIQGG